MAIDLSFLPDQKDTDEKDKPARTKQISRTDPILQNQGKPAESIDLSFLPDQKGPPRQKQQKADLSFLPDKEPLTKEQSKLRRVTRAVNTISELAFPSIIPRTQPESIFNRGQRTVGATALSFAGSQFDLLDAAQERLGVDLPGKEEIRKTGDKLASMAQEIAVKNPGIEDRFIGASTSMALFLIPGKAVQSAVSLAPRMGRMAMKLAPTIGTSITTVLEAGTEAGSLYRDLISEGRSRTDAADQASKAFFANVGLLGLTNRLGLFGRATSEQLAALRSAGFEGLQEAGQQIISDVLRTKEGEAVDVNWTAVAEGAGFGTILGGGAGVLTAQPKAGPIQQPTQPREAQVPPPPTGPAQVQQEAPVRQPSAQQPEGASIEAIIDKQIIEEQKPKKAQETIRERVEQGERPLPRQEQQPTQKNVVPPPPAPPPDGITASVERPSMEMQFLRRQSQGEPLVMSQRFALKRLFQRQAAAAATAARATTEKLTELKTGLSEQISQILPETERGNFLDRVAKANTPKQVETVIQQALRQSERVMKRGPRTITEREALKRVMQRAAEASRQTTRDLTHLKNNLANDIKSQLPIHERGKFLNRVAKASNLKDVKDVSLQISHAAEEIEKKRSISDLKRIAERSLVSPQVDVIFKRQIQEVIDEFNFRRPTGKRIERLTKLREKVRQDIESGRDVTVRKQVLDAIQILDRRAIQDLDTPSIQAILDKVNALAEAGQQARLGFQEIYDREKGEKLNRLLTQRPAGISFEDMIQKQPGEPIRFSERGKNLLIQGRNAAKSLDIALTPTNALMDMLDGMKNYSGAHMQIFKRPIDINYRNFLNDVDEKVLPIVKFSNENNISEESRERISVYAYRVQPGGRQYLLNTGLTDTQIDAISLTDKEMSLYKKMREQMDAAHGPVSALMRELFNENVGKLENYFPVQVDYSLLQDEAVQVRMADLLHPASFSLKTKSVQKSFVKKRQGTQRPIKLDALRTFDRYMTDALYLTNMQRDVKMLYEIANSQEYKQAHGPLASELMTEWLDSMARNGGAADQRVVPILDFMRRNFGVATLGFKLSTIMIQFSALGDGAAQVGKDVFPSFGEVVKSGEIRNFIQRNSPEIRQRGGGDPAYTDLSTFRPFGLNIAKAQNVGFLPLKMADALTASGVFWAQYKKSVRALGLEPDLNTPVESALLDAEAAVQRTQSAGFAKDIPPALRGRPLTGALRFGSGTRSVNRALLQFKNFILTRWSQLRHHAWRAGVQQGNLRQAVEATSWISLATMVEVMGRYGASAMMAGLGVAAVKGIDAGIDAALNDIDDESEEWLKDWAREMTFSVPFFSDLYYSALFETIPIPAFSSIEQLPRSVRQTLTAKTPESRIRAGARAAGFAGSLMGIPGSRTATDLVGEALKRR